MLSAHMELFPCIIGEVQHVWRVLSRGLRGADDDLLRAERSGRRGGHLLHRYPCRNTICDATTRHLTHGVDAENYAASLIGCMFRNQVLVDIRYGPTPELPGSPLIIRYRVERDQVVIPACSSQCPTTNAPVSQESYLLHARPALPESRTTRRRLCRPARSIRSPAACKLGASGRDGIRFRRHRPAN